MSEPVQNIVLLALLSLALWGAFDYIVESVHVFLRSVRRYRKRNRDE